uniref:Uncharacterized protein n=1 Tax=Arundo donax TaxID=35708 RepID=A0A0A8Y5D4_ARUDO
MEAAVAGTVAYHSVNGSARQLIASPSPTSMPGVEVRRRILGSISPSSLKPDSPACIKSCPAAGRPYTSRGCKNVYQCG